MDKPDILFVPDEDKERGFKYRFVNVSDRNLRLRKYQGWEVCEFKDSDTRLSPMPGQTTDTPNGGVTRQRGDVVLMRMAEDDWERKVGRKVREARERQYGSLDAMVEGSNDKMRAAARRAGLSRIPTQLVFREDSPSVGNKTMDIGE